MASSNFSPQGSLPRSTVNGSATAPPRESRTAPTPAGESGSATAPAGERGMAPTPPGERIVELDILRGFALLGILLVNMQLFNSPSIYDRYIPSHGPSHGLDRAADVFLLLFAEGKFYTAFSFLFGLGFYLFVSRAGDKVRRPRLLYIRRVSVLLLLGVVHAAGFWYGDILVLYALLGFLLPAFYRCKPGTLLAWALSLLAVPILLTALTVGLAQLGESVSPGSYSAYGEELVREMEERSAASHLAYGNGTAADIMAQRLSDLSFMYNHAFMNLLMILPLFLLGVYAGQKRWFQRGEEGRSFFRRLWGWSLFIGAPMTAIKYAGLIRADPLMPGMADVMQVAGMVIGDPAVSLFYLSSILLLVQSPAWWRFLLPLAAPGRMAVSNYLLQTVICTTLFYNYGVGLYGTFGAFASLLAALLVFALQIPLSRAWLARYRFGPVEWLWRMLTYGRLEPMNRDTKQR